MDETELLSKETCRAWGEALGRLLTLLPKSKRAEAISDAAFVEATALTWRQMAMKAEGE